MIRVVELPVTETDLLSLHAANPQRYPYLLESRALQKGACGWDILFAFPGEVLKADSAPFLQQLDQQWQADNCAESDSLELPFTGGWFLFLDYELAHEIEPILSKEKVQKSQSSSFATRIPAAVLYDRSKQRLILVEEKGSDKIALMQQDLENLSPLPEPVSVSVNGLHEESSAQFLNSVQRIKEYIVEGDVFQVNLSRQWCAELDPLEPYQLYQQLRNTNPAPFAGLVLQDGKAIISSSPERLVKVKSGIAATRPIAGTHPRAADTRQDQHLSQQLLAHPKEQAEHIMLIDLERNDLGRVCQPGSIEVDELMVLESYAHVHHIVSSVKGRLKPETTPGAVIRALFPGGTITGCPKVRCMEIIDELETEPREAYTGSFGYLNRDGSMDLNILIRTLMMKDQQVTLRAGAGIVYDSIPEQELAETRSKAKGMLLALGVSD